jgi:hypothetical protein
MFSAEAEDPIAGGQRGLGRPRFVLWELRMRARRHELLLQPPGER